jgi:hypothetical protein
VKRGRAGYANPRGNAATLATDFLTPKAATPLSRRQRAVARAIAAPAHGSSLLQLRSVALSARAWARATSPCATAQSSDSTPNSRPCAGLAPFVHARHARSRLGLAEPRGNTERAQASLPSPQGRRHLRSASESCGSRAKARTQRRLPRPRRGGRRRSRRRSEPRTTARIRSLPDSKAPQRLRRPTRLYPCRRLMIVWRLTNWRRPDFASPPTGRNEWVRMGRLWL